jgi:hypothetical protein
VLWNGVLPPEGLQTASAEITVEESGLYMLWADGNHYGPSIYGASTGFHLNVSESGTAVSEEVFLEPPPPPPPSRPYVVKMDLDGVPALNRPVTLRVTIASKMDLTNATFRIFLPEGIELVGGDLEWRGDLRKGIDQKEIRGLGVTKEEIPETILRKISESQKVRIRATIRPIAQGDWQIVVFPSQKPPPVINCYADELGLGIPTRGGAGWKAVSYGGCLNIRVYNETAGVFSEQDLEKALRRPHPTPPPTTPLPGVTPSSPSD